MKLTRKKAEEIGERMYLDKWIALQMIDKCSQCKKKISLYRENKEFPGIKELNPDYLFHQKATHGMPPEFIVDWIAETLYKNEEDKESERVII